MKKYILFILVASLLTLCLTCTTKSKQLEQTKKDNVLDGAFWKDQALQDIMPYWYKYSRDEKNGAFLPNLDRNWQQMGDTDKIPGMIGRHIFSYSTAYLFSGDEKYLQVAKDAVDYLIKYGWDKQYGGWYDAITGKGQPSRTTKYMFNQIYVNTGLVMYYLVTHDLNALHYVEESNKIIETCCWDKQEGGYFEILNRDLTVKSSDKDFTSQFAPVSGYLLYQYLLTHNQNYLEQMERIVASALSHMIDAELKWVLERFDRDWRYTYQLSPDGTEINVGHNIETTWVLLRLYNITRKEKYLRKAQPLAEQINQHCYDPEKGVWYDTIGRLDPAAHRETAAWWTQAYGNMFQLYLYHISPDPEYLNRFSKGAEFWNRYFLDKDKGGDYTCVYLDSRVCDGNKASAAKTSYHSMEHCLLNYLYLNLWVKHVPVELNFAIMPQESEFKHYVLPIEDNTARISKVTVNGEDWESYNANERYITLPAKKILKVQVILKK